MQKKLNQFFSGSVTTKKTLKPESFVLHGLEFKTELSQTTVSKDLEDIDGVNADEVQEPGVIYFAAQREQSMKMETFSYAVEPIDLISHGIR